MTKTIEILAVQVAKKFIESGKTLSIAESFTGGALTSALVQIPDTGKFLQEGIVTYTNESKIERLLVSKKDLEKHTAVSEEIAKQMVKHLSQKTDYAISTTGSAGDTNNQAAQGEYYIALAKEGKTIVIHRTPTGTRKEVIEDGVQSALQILLEAFS